MRKTKVVVDASIVLFSSSTLVMKHDSIDLVAPGWIEEELRKSNLPFDSTTFNRAVEDRTLTVVPVDFTSVQSVILGGIRSSGTELNAIVLAKLAKDEQSKKGAEEEPVDVFLATNSDSTRKLASEFGITCLDGNQLTQLFGDARIYDEKVANAVRERVRQRWQKLLLSTAGAIGVAALLVLAWQYRVTIVSTISIWGTLSVLIFSSGLAYYVRGRQRLAYGITEVLVGLILMASVLYPDFDLTVLNNSSLLTILSGIYVTVRGQDNIAKGLEGTPFENNWKKYSGEK